MLNFTVGPVQSNELVRAIGAEQVPYFRTEEFSSVVLENECLIRKMCKAETDSRVLFITGSGTASMEATVMNVFSERDKVLIVNGGGFGQRFVNMCRILHIPYAEIKPIFGTDITQEQLSQYENSGYTGFLVNLHETSTGVLYNINRISEFCKRNNIFLVVDAISAFLSDPIDMVGMNIGVIIISSQKALACPPGISIIVLSSEGVERIENNQVRSMYFDLKSALKDGERGQTPFTPAVGVIRQINVRLKDIDNNGGSDAELQRIKNIALDFRKRIQGLPLNITSKSLSNAVTPLHPLNVTAYSVFLTLKNNYDIWVCPNGGALSDYLFRVGHIGDLTEADNTILIKALWDMHQHRLL